MINPERVSMEQLGREPSTEEKEEEKGANISFLEMNQGQEDALKKRIEGSSGLVRIFIHPYFSEYLSSGYVEHVDPFKGVERVKRLEKAFNRTIASQSELLPPIIIFQNAGDKEEYEELLVEHEKKSQNDLYLIRTEAHNANPLPLSRAEGYYWHQNGDGCLPTEEEGKEMWEKTIDKFKALGIKKILIAGMELETSPEKGGKHGGCLGQAINELGGEFEIEVSLATWPGYRQDVKNPRPLF